MCYYGTQERPCLGEGAKMVIGTEGRGPEFLFVRMRKKTASFLKRLKELQKVPTVRMRLMSLHRELKRTVEDNPGSQFKADCTS